MRIPSSKTNRTTSTTGSQKAVAQAGVKGLKKEDYDAAAKKVLKPQSLVWVVVGDRAKIEEGVKALNLGALSIVDADGNPVK